MSDPENNLPPVQPPSASFLMQLFVVPMVIVVVIVLVCLMFNWLAHLGTTPQDLVDDLSKLNAGSWQKALTIANMLTDQHQEELRKDSELAQQLSTLLDQQLEDGNMEPERIKLRVYLCMALGVMEASEGLPTLIKAARIQRDPAEVQVQLTALEALARRADAEEERRAELRRDVNLIAALDEVDSQFSDQPAQADLDASLRERATYVYGVLGGSQAMEKLSSLLSDPHATVRYNAAVGLARYGDERATPRLLEMLSMSAASGDTTGLDDFTREVVIRNALRATVQLSAASPDADLGELRAAIQELAENADGELSNRIAMDAKMTLYKLDEANAPVPASRG